MRGGWRWNAGRPAQHAKVEQCLSLEVGGLAKAGILDGRRCDWVWTNTDTGKRLGSIGVQGAHAAVVLSYTFDAQDVWERVAIERTPCHYGGSRPWFNCPRCGARAQNLYFAHGRFACRSCHGLRYRSQSEDDCGRSWRKQRKLEARLGENWRRPKGMHKATRTKLLEAIWRCEEVREDALAAYMDRVGFKGW